MENFTVELVRLVHDDEIHIRTLATRNRLDGADLDGLIAVGSLVDSLHDANAVNTFSLERGDGLVDEAKRINYERDTLALCERAPNDVCRDDGLAGAGRRLKQGAALAGRQRCS